MLSPQSVSSQHCAQPALQQRWLVPQPESWHMPLTQLALTQGLSLRQSVGELQLVLRWQPDLSMHTSPLAHSEESGKW